MEQAGVVDLITAVNAADRDLCAWIQERLRPLANQPHAIRLTVQAGGGKISVKREHLPERSAS